MSRRLVTTGAVALMGIALWLLLSATAQAQIDRGGPAPTRTPIQPTLVPGATPTPDRLAPPPTAAAPNQADEGAQLYWLHCQPCHGDQGQGLTDEWRMQYPPEEQYCWESGCHGPRPYDQAFALPTSVPAIVGPAVDRIMGTEGTQVLTRFETLDGVYRYTSAAMPYFFPGELEQGEYLAILAHIARENGIWDGTTLTTGNLADYPLRPGAAEPAPPAGTGHLTGGAAGPAGTPVTAASGRAPAVGPVEFLLIGGGFVVVLMLIGGVVLWRSRAR